MTRSSFDRSEARQTEQVAKTHHWTFGCDVGLNGVQAGGGGSVLSAPEEYRRKAAQCVLVAEDTNDIGSRLLLLQMAHAWLLLAEQAEKNTKLDLTYETPPSQPQPSTEE